MELIGVYIVDNHPDVHLIELQFDEAPDHIDVGQITQELEGQPTQNWQCPWDEKYLNESGEEIIGDYFDLPKDESKTRLLLFFHYLILSKPIRTQYGQLNLVTPYSLPDRLRDKVKYERPA